MKRNMKKILILLSMLVCFLGITAFDNVNNSIISEKDIFMIGFVVVIILLIIILAMLIHNNKLLKQKYNAVNTAVNDTKAQIFRKEESELRNLELVAVITAAIAASEGKSSDEFVVRSIKKVNKSRWQDAL